MTDNVMHLAQGKDYSLDCYQTQLNNNVLIVGGSGTGKTRGIVSPNIIEATGSYIISDPKGNLYNTYKGYLEHKGYEVKKLDFTDPGNSCKYNFFDYIEDEIDVLKLAHIFVYQSTDNTGHHTTDDFWDKSAQLYIEACMFYVLEALPKEEHNLRTLLQIMDASSLSTESESEKNTLDAMMTVLEKEKPESLAPKYNKRIRSCASRTMRSIIISALANIAHFDTDSLAKMTSADEVNIKSIGKKKTALFVVVSDMDRSMDMLANIFFTQAMSVLCKYADKECPGNALPVPVRFILDDFATNVRIDEFPRMISSIRSRNISTMLMIQSEAQLQNSYSADGQTIISNCDTYVYLGGNDLGTATELSKRLDLPLKKILYMPVGTNIIFRRGQEPCWGKNIDLLEFVQEAALAEDGMECSGKTSIYR